MAPNSSSAPSLPLWGRPPGDPITVTTTCLPCRGGLKAQIGISETRTMLAGRWKQDRKWEASLV